MTSTDRIALEGPTVFFTGAGISVGAGLPTYRGSRGMYENTDAEPPQARDAEPDRLPALWERFRARLTGAEQVTPSRAHLHLADLEVAHGLDATVVTQNVDGLHTAAGSSTVHELHGNLQRVRCLGAGHRAMVDETVWGEDGCPECPACGSPCRPDVVLFGESLPGATWDAAQESMASAQTVVAIGTSAVVYPAAHLIDGVRRDRRYDDDLARRHSFHPPSNATARPSPTTQSFVQTRSSKRRS